MQPASPHSGRGSRGNRPSITSTPSRSSHRTPNLSQRPVFDSPSAPIIGSRHAQPNPGPARFPTTLVQHPTLTNVQGHFAQSPWSLPPLDASGAMLLTAIAMVLDEDDPSPANTPHVGLYWGKNTERVGFFDYVVTIIKKLCILLDGVADCTLLVEAVSSDDKTHQMRYHSRAIGSMPLGGSVVDGISAQVLALAAQAHENTFKTERCNNYNAAKGVLSVWATNGGFHPAKWADAPLPIRFDHALIPAISSVLHNGATSTPPSPFLTSPSIDLTLSPVLWFQPRALTSVAPVPPLVSATADLNILDDEELIDEQGYCGGDDDEGEQWVPFAYYKGLKEAIEGVWCTRFDIAPEFADGVRIMLYEEDPKDWARYLKKFTKAGAATVEDMVKELQSYVDQMERK